MRSTAFLWHEYFHRISVYFIHYFPSHNVSIYKQILTQFSTSLYFRFFIVCALFYFNRILYFLLFSLS